MSNFFETIAAISTPYGRGGVALIRVSGEDSIKICSKILSLPASYKNGLDSLDSNKTVYAKIKTKDGKQIDDGMVTVFRAPKSFTGENTVEICCHGGVLVTEKVLRATFEAGARPAERGEFTQRAFLSGKISLSRAEAIGALIDAKTDAQADIFAGDAPEALCKKTEDIYEKMRTLLADMYARIDFPEEDLGELSSEEIENSLKEITEELASLKQTYNTGKAVSEGIKTVICGKTNVGKSSLYNKLVGREAAIVTDIEGTTRDLLEETVSFGKITLHLFDTAGIRGTSDTVEKIGIDRAKAKIDEAELVFALFDNSKPLEEDDKAFIKDLKNKKGTVIAVINKTDKERLLEIDEIKDNFDKVVEISAETSDGINELEKTVENAYTDSSLDLSRDAFIMNGRQFSAVSRAYEAAKEAYISNSDSFTQDVSSADLERAMTALAEISGRNAGEDIISEIFGKFCVGK